MPSHRNAVSPHVIHNPLSILNRSSLTWFVVDQSAGLLVELQRQTADQLRKIRRRSQGQRPPRNVSIVSTRDDIASCKMHTIDVRTMGLEYPDQPRGRNIPESNGAISGRRHQDRLI